MSQEFRSRPGIAWHEDIALLASGIPSSSLDSLCLPFHGTLYTLFPLEVVSLSVIFQIPFLPLVVSISQSLGFAFIRMGQGFLIQTSSHGWRSFYPAL